ncbi:MAG: hypothetical protein GY810_01880 [Aureispira sp.]|nr:hypothetical protein [Aureispira sp.]
MYQKIIGAFAGSLILVSAFLPWIRIGDTSISGMNNPEGISEGILVLIFGAMIIGFSMRGSNWSAIAGALAAVYLVVNVMGVMKVVGDFNQGGTVKYGLGMGMYLMLIMSVVVILSSVVSILRSKESLPNT